MRTRYGAGVGLPELGWRLVFLMAGCLHIGNALKDLVCAPRPTGLEGKGGGDFRPKLITSNAEAATYALVSLLPASAHSCPRPRVEQIGRPRQSLQQT